jgi:hypothetical protein
MKETQTVWPSDFRSMAFRANVSVRGSAKQLTTAADWAVQLIQQNW